MPGESVERSIDNLPYDLVALNSCSKREPKRIKDSLFVVLSTFKMSEVGNVKHSTLLTAGISILFVV